MAQYPKPSSSSGTFNNTSFNNNQTGGLTIAEGLKYFVSFPKTQTPSTITADNFSTTGNLDVAGDSQFGGDVNFLGGVSITGGITFKDDVEVEGTTTLDDTLLCLKDATIDGELTITNNVILEPSDLTPTVAPYLQLTNGVGNEYCQLYLDPQLGYDMTLYTNQNPGGGLTIRGANGQSFTMNPYAVQDGTGCQFQNPVDMNGNTLSGIINLYSDGSTYNIKDSTGTSILQLTNNGHTTYEDINMNGHNLDGVTGVVAGVGTITFYDNTISPMLQLTNSGHTSYENINMGANNITNANTISSNVYNINTYGTIDQSGANNGMVITNNAPYINGAQATIAFNLNGPSGIFNPLKIYNNGINCTVDMNMNNSNINGINTLTGYGGGNIVSGSNINMSTNDIINVDNVSFASSGSNSVASFQNNVNQNGGIYFVLSTNEGYSIAINGVEKTRYDGTNCQFFSPVILPTGSTAITQPDNTSNTTIATTEFVKSNTPVYTSSTFTLTTPNMTLNPSPVPTITTYTSANNVVLFNSSLFTITTTASGLFTLINIVFGPNPFPNYPPTSLNDSMTVFCTTNNTTYTTSIYWTSYTPASLTILYPQGAPTNSGVVFNMDLATIGAFYS